MGMAPVSPRLASPDAGAGAARRRHRRHGRRARRGVQRHQSEGRSHVRYGQHDPRPPGTLAGARLSTDLAAIRDRFGPADVVTHQALPVPGSVSTVDLRSEDPGGAYTRVTLRLDAGRYPNGAGEVALTSDVAKTFDLHIGSVWSEGGRPCMSSAWSRTRLDLRDQFALVAPGQAPGRPASPSSSTPASRVCDRSGCRRSRPRHRIAGRQQQGRQRNDHPRARHARTGVCRPDGGGRVRVMAQRRLRALGMLGSIGATDRHIRLVMVANGAAVGATAAVVGTATAGRVVCVRADAAVDRHIIASTPSPCRGGRSPRPWS